MTHQSLHKMFIGCGAFLLGCFVIALAWQAAQKHESQKTERDAPLQNTEYSIKEMLDVSDLAWIGRVAKNEDSEQYELVRVRNGEETIIETFPYHACTSSLFDHDGGGRFRFTYTTSPCEAFQHFTNIVFDSSGEETIRETHQTDGGPITFQGPFQKPHKVAIRTSGGCTEATYTMNQDGSYNVPQTTLYGISIELEGGVKNFDLPTPTTVNCGIAYGDSPTEPFASDIFINTGILAFSLPNKIPVQISLKDGYPREVRLNNAVVTGVPTSIAQ